MEELLEHKMKKYHELVGPIFDEVAAWADNEEDNNRDVSEAQLQTKREELFRKYGIPQWEDWKKLP